VARFSAMALAAVVLPAAIVAVLGWVSLRQWERAADLLVREQARDMASMAAEKVEMALAHAEDAFVDRLQALLTARGADPAALEALLAGEPLVRHLVLADMRGEVRYPRGAAAEAASGGSAARARRSVEARDVGPLVATFGLDVEALRRDVLPASLGPLGSGTILAVFDGEGRTVYAPATLEGAQPLQSVAFRAHLPDWRLTVYQPGGAAPRDAVRGQTRLFMGAFVVLLVIILAGSLLTWRLTRRETEMARLKSDFVANVSHDLKTPLSVIRMFGETLEMGRVTDEGGRQEYYRVITREAERLSRLIDNVLDFSRIEGGRRRYERVPTAVEPLLREALDAFAYPLQQQGFKVELVVAPDLPEVAMDPEAIGQALSNLVDNAIKYSAEDRVLSVAARVEGSELLLSVADRGVGIPASEQARIFEKFYRVGRSDTQGRRGSGVGLALVRHVVGAHGGRVTVESAPGQGSRFTLRLPLA
jgi:signal transduction histidine kinase